LGAMLTGTMDGAIVESLWRLHDIEEITTSVTSPSRSGEASVLTGWSRGPDTKLDTSILSCSLYAFGFGELVCEYSGGRADRMQGLGCYGSKIFLSLYQLTICFLSFCRLLAYCLCIGVGYIFLCIPLGFCTYTPFHPSRFSFSVGWVFFPNGRKNFREIMDWSVSWRYPSCYEYCYF